LERERTLPTKSRETINTRHSEWTKPGEGFRGGKQRQRHRDFGIKEKEFWRWWDQRGNKEYGGRDIANRKEGEEIYDDWKDLMGH